MAEAKLDAIEISPTLTVNDMARSLRFYTEALGFEVERTHEADGAIAFAGLRAGTARLSLAQDDFAKGRDRHKGIAIRVWLRTTQDIRELAARAKAAGVTLDADAAPLPWGPMAFEVTDPDGFKLTIANPNQGASGRPV